MQELGYTVFEHIDSSSQELLKSKISSESEIALNILVEELDGLGAIVIAIYSSDTYQQFDLGGRGTSQVIASMWKYYNCLFIGTFLGICMIIVSADLLMMRKVKKQKNK